MLKSRKNKTYDHYLIWSYECVCACVLNFYNLNNKMYTWPILKKYMKLNLCN